MSQHQTLLDIYQQKIDSAELSADSEQFHVLQQMDAIAKEIEKFQQQKQQFSLKNYLTFSSKEKIQAPKGIYLWGGVGRGKTHLLDLFFKTVKVENKLRIHFHRFMLMIHEQLDELGQIKAPLHQLAADFAKQYDLICLDEMFVADIGDAMILATLMQQLIDHQVLLLFTSNSQPAELYQHGLQRARFLPAIELLKKQTHIIELKGELDYRTQTLTQTPMYLLTDEPDSSKIMEEFFQRMISSHLHQGEQEILINYRSIEVIKWESGVLWLNFDSLCNTHRDSSDYIQIATLFHTIIIADIYSLTDEQLDIVRRFINFIDVCYDRHINLMISASIKVDKIYKGKRLSFEFSRTISRLHEMQSKDYLSKNKIFNINKTEYGSTPLEIDEDLQLNNPTRYGDWVCHNGRCSDF